MKKIFLSCFLLSLLLLLSGCGAIGDKNASMTIIYIATTFFAFLLLLGYSFGIYYKSVTLEMVDGVAVLNKEYGPWHSIYLFYLVGYFVTMLATAIHATVKRELSPYPMP